MINGFGMIWRPPPVTTTPTTQPSRGGNGAWVDFWRGLIGSTVGALQYRLAGQYGPGGQSRDIGMAMAEAQAAQAAQTRQMMMIGGLILVGAFAISIATRKS